MNDNTPSYGDHSKTAVLQSFWKYCFSDLAPNCRVVTAHSLVSCVGEVEKPDENLVLDDSTLAYSFEFEEFHNLNNTNARYS